MRVMGERPYPVSETFVTSAGRRSHPPRKQPADAQLQLRKHEVASRRLQELEAHARESCSFREKSLDSTALQIALKERCDDRVCSETGKHITEVTSR